MNNQNNNQQNNKCLTTDNVKRLFAFIGFMTYTISVIIKNQNMIQLGQYEYIFVIIIGLCMAVVDSTRRIEQIINHFDHDKLDDAINKLNTISETMSLTNRTNEYATCPDNESNTHRDVKINDQYTIRVKN